MGWGINKPLIGLTLLLFPYIATATPTPVAPHGATPQRYGVFEEPLVAFDSPSHQQRKKLEAAISAYTAAGNPGHFAALTHYLEHAPHSPWRASLLLNMALASKRDGYFSNAITLLNQARRASASADTAEEKALDARVLGELLDLHTRFGHVEQVAALLAKVKVTPETASVSEQITQARAGLAQMQNTPEEALRCGIVALQALVATQTQEADAANKLDAVKAGPQGTTLAQLQALASSEGLVSSAVYRKAGEPIPVPSVVHWRVGHYATILGEANGRYRVADPALGGELWMSPDAIDAEASGYFLVPGSGNITQPWQPLSRVEAAEVIGGGYTSQNQPNQTSDDDLTECDKPCGDTSGMPRYRVHSMLVSLNIRDTPVGYTPPVGPGVAMTVTYSQREVNQPSTYTFFNLGHKWTFNWLSYVQDDPRYAGSRVMIYLPGGGSRDYGGYSSSTGKFTPEQRTGAQLVRLSATQYERRMPDGSRYVYGQSDGSSYYPRRVFLTQIVDPEGNAVRLHYDTRLRLTSITDAVGKETTFSYTNADKPLLITGVSDPFGRSATFGYDGSGRLNAITDAIGMTSTFQYDGGTFIQAMTTPYGTTHFAYGQSGTTRWLNITDPNGDKERVEYRHGASGIPFTDSPVPSGMNLFNRYINGRNTFYWDREAMKRAAGNYKQARIRHWYHLRTNTSVTTGVLESVKNPLENRIWYNYPGQSWGGAEGTLDKPSIIGRVLSDGSTQLTHKSYNTFGKLTKVVDPVGREMDMEYAPNQIDLVRVKRKTASGYVVLAEFTYNDKHHPLSYTDVRGITSTFTYNAAGQLTSATNALGHSTRYHYDDAGYLQSIVDANGNTIVHYTYDAVGRIASETDAAGYTLGYDYDNLDRRVRTIYPDGTHEDITWDKLDVISQEDRYGNVTHYAYDAVRNLLSSVDPSGHSTHFGYFANGKLASVTDGKGNTTQFERDIQRRRTGITLADGSYSSTAYDNSGRRILNTDAMDGKTSYTFAHDNRLNELTDPNGNTTHYHYDGYTGELIERNSPDTGTTHFRYDNAGNLIERTDAEGNTTSYTYDALNRITHVAYADGKTVDNLYDTAPNGIGRLAESRGPAGTTSFAYDKRGNIVTQTYTATGGSAQVVRYAYNDAGLATDMTYPSGAVVQYSYVQGRLSGIKVNGQTLLDHLAYDPFGPVSGWIWGNGQQNLRSYDANGRLQSFDIGTEQRNLSYDTVGNITAVAGDTVNQQFGYDALQRLTAANADNLELGYAYDANGNRTTVQDNGITQAYLTVPGSNRLATVDTTTYQYDTNGNTLSDGNHQYTFDASNRLVAVDGGMTASYGYDAFGQRVKKTATQTYQLSADLNGDGKVTEADIHVLQDYIRNHQSPPEADLNQDEQVDAKDTPCIATLIGQSKNQGKGQTDIAQSTNGKGAGGPHSCHVGEWITTTRTTHFVYDGSNLLGEYDASGKAQQETVWVGNRPVGTLRDGQLYAVHTDQLGAPRALTNANGTVVWRWEPAPFGDTPANEDPDGDGNSINYNLRFSGQYYDSETGKYYNYFRYYDPAIGRYMGSDPIGLAGGINTYAYVSGNPLLFMDPYGLFGWADMPALPQGLVDFSAGFGDTLSFGLTNKVRDLMGTNGVVNKCSSAFSYGEWSGIGLSVAFGGAHLARNALYQTGARGGIGLGLRRLFSDPRTWGATRDMWSRAAGNGTRALAARGQSLHHWLIPQRWFKYNAGINYIPLSASFNSWMNGSTAMRIAVEQGLKALIAGIYAAPITAMGDDCECSK